MTLSRESISFKHPSFTYSISTAQSYVCISGNWINRLSICLESLEKPHRRHESRRIRYDLWPGSISRRDSGKSQGRCRLFRCLRCRYQVDFSISHFQPGLKAQSIKVNCNSGHEASSAETYILASIVMYRLAFRFRQTPQIARIIRFSFLMQKCMTMLQMLTCPWMTVGKLFS